MPKPEDVNPQNFQVDKILYNDGDFSIAWGQWENNEMRLGMRWNGEAEDPGYPKLFNHPVWFVLPEALALPILKSLIGINSSVNNNVLDVLNRLFK